MAKSKILLENEENIGSIPLQKKPVLTEREQLFFDFHYYAWIVVQLWIKRMEGRIKYGYERFKELSEEKNSVRAVDRYFLHKFVPSIMFEGMEIQHFWHEDMVATYDYCAIWTRHENQVIELRQLKKKGWDIEGIVCKFEEAINFGKEKKKEDKKWTKKRK